MFIDSSTLKLEKTIKHNLQWARDPTIVGDHLFLSGRYDNKQAILRTTPDISLGSNFFIELEEIQLEDVQDSRTVMEFTNLDNFVVSVIEWPSPDLVTQYQEDLEFLLDQSVDNDVVVPSKSEFLFV